MASWKLCLLVLLAVFLVLASEADANRRNGRRRGGRRRQGGRGNGDNTEVTASDNSLGGTDNDNDAPETATGEVNVLPRRAGGRRRGGAGGGGGRGAGGRRRGGGGGGRGGRGRGRPGRGQRPGGGLGRGRGRGRGGRRPTAPVDEAAKRLLGDYSVSNGHFGVDLYREMANNADNFAISPLSIHSALSMLLLGASGRTKVELVRGLHIRSPIHPAFRMYNQSIGLEEGSNTTFVMANAIYTRPDFQVKARFMNNLRNFYETSVAQFDEDEPEADINDWVAEKTMDKIQDFLEDGEVTDDMVMMLLNAVYFKGTWMNTFDEEDTTLESFNAATGENHDIYMLKREGYYNVHHSDALGARVLKMPYKDGRYSFNVILPDEGVELSTVESRMSHDLLNETLHALSQENSRLVSLSLPKFGLDTERSLRDLLAALGISNIFASNANFRRMTAGRVAVSQVKHRSVIEVDERGTEAAAVTGIGMVATSLVTPVEYSVDKPFMFVLRDDATSVNLFMGRYTDPQGDNIMD